MFDECQESQYINNIFSVVLRSLELDPKEQRSCLEKMLCAFTAVICHPASMTDPTEDEPKQRVGDFFCNEDNKIYLLLDTNHKDEKKCGMKIKEGYEIFAFLANTPKYTK